MGGIDQQIIIGGHQGLMTFFQTVSWQHDKLGLIAIILANRVSSTTMLLVEAKVGPRSGFGMAISGFYGQRSWRRRIQREITRQKEGIETSLGR